VADFYYYRKATTLKIESALSSLSLSRATISLSFSLIHLSVCLFLFFFFLTFFFLSGDDCYTNDVFK